MVRVLTVDELEVGMIVNNDIINQRTGTILITQDTVLTEGLIKRIISNGIEAVKIKKKVSPSNANEELMESYSKVEKKLDALFDNFKNGNKLEVNEIFDEMEYFAQEVSKERDILTQMRMLKKKDDYTFNHSLSVSILSISLGKWINYPKDKIFDLSIAGLFHDLGKLMISDDIINKPSKLTNKEFEVIKKHSLYSYDILRETGRFNEDILLGISQHHEKMNGLGYPHQLKSKDIHEYAKIISICDIYDALVSRRAYKEKENPLTVADYMRHESFETLDPRLTHIFLDNISKFYVGNRVTLSNGRTGVIVYIHPQDKTKPIVKVGNDFINFLIEREIEILDIIV